MNDCLSDNAIQAYAEGKDQNEGAERHMALCTYCRSRVSDLAICLGDWQHGRSVPGQPEVLAQQIVRRYIVAPRSGGSRWIAIAAAAVIVAGVSVALFKVMSAPSETPVVQKPPPPPAPPPPAPAPSPTPKAPRIPLPEPSPEPPPVPPMPEPLPEPEPTVIPEPSPSPEPVPSPSPAPSPVPSRPPDTRPEPRKSPIPTRIIAARGTLKLQHKDKPDGDRAVSRTEIVDGDRLTSPGGVKARVELGDGSSVCLNPNSEVEFSRVGELPPVIDVLKGEVVIESTGKDGPLAVRVAGKEISSSSAFYNLKAGLSSWTVTMVTGKATADGVAMEADTQTTIGSKGVESPRKFPSAGVVTKWSDPMRQVVFQDDFEPSLDAWSDKHVNPKMFKVAVDEGQLVGRNHAVEGEFRNWGLMSKAHWKIDQAYAFETTLTQDRVADFFPKFELVKFKPGGEVQWKLGWTLWGGKDALATETAGKDNNKERGENSLWRGTVEMKGGQVRRVQILIDAKDVILALDGNRCFRGAHGLTDLTDVMVCVGQEGKLDRKGSEVRFEQVEVRRIGTLPK